MKPFAAAATLAAAMAGVAHAEPGGTSSASGVAVSAGVLKLEARSAYFDGGAIDGNWLQRVQASYGPTSWWRTQLNLRASQPDGEDLELRSVGWENAVDFTATRTWPVRFGGQVEYKWGVNGARDAVEFKLLAERRVESFNVRFNLTAERQVGDDASDEWAHGYALRTTWTLDDRYQLGFEGFGEIDNHAHAWGPRAGIVVGPAVFSVAYLAGIDDSQSDSQVRLVLEFTP